MCLGTTDTVVNMPSLLFNEISMGIVLVIIPLGLTFLLYHVIIVLFLSIFSIENRIRNPSILFFL